LKFWLLFWLRVNEKVLDVELIGVELVDKLVVLNEERSIVAAEEVNDIVFDVVFCIVKLYFVFFVVVGKLVVLKILFVITVFNIFIEKVVPSCLILSINFFRILKIKTLSKNKST
jgi:hypothetical protein